MTFSDLGLAEPILRSLISEGYTIPTPIQAKAIPVVMEGKDILGCAQTGTGKTAAFALPILHRLASAKPVGSASVDAHSSQHSAPGSTALAAGSTQHTTHSPRLPRVLVLSPTRELASQIAESFKVYGRHLNLRYAVIFGGMNQNPQVASLRSGVDVIIATPGRLEDLMNQRHVNLTGIETLVLDEADQMLDMGFITPSRCSAG
jgi:ATP-dependent RNA helicase RhlE